ncbi:nuclear receptor coactivator 5 [Periophthalmus magnuspinnatus]|uniref:nuclear receptor coactivator 5 n=1 Tax=Periophthalmus magnuspinnatus TaxID=409849 RepID=UPI00145A5A23|nr:nuclear receptor coactivator 5 [Periophthalmus magnuspinnatus]
MSKTWSHPLPRRSPGSFHASRALRRSAPYNSKEDRADDLKHGLDRYEELDKSQTYPSVNYEGYSGQEQATKIAIPSGKVEGTPSDRRKALYQKFYKQLQEERKPADCVILSVTNESPEYSISLGQSLQERGLYVEMLYLHAESGLTRALQDIRADGSPLCILLEQTNIALCSCTVIIFAQSLKIHRNMPKDQALDFVVAEYNQGLAEERPSKDPADIAAETSQMLDDYLDREKRNHHYVPSDVRRLLMFLAEGVHLYPEELDTLSEYVLSRQEQAGKTKGEVGSLLPAGLGKPPPLLPTPIPSQPQLGHPSRALPVLQGNPPPLMSKPTFGSLPGHMSAPRAPLLDTPRYPRGPPRRLGPPVPRMGSRPALLPRPGGPLLPRPRAPLL